MQNVFLANKYVDRVLPKQKPYIIYQYADKVSFVQKDIDLLSERYEVLSQHHEWRNKYMTPLFLLSQLWFYLKNMWRYKAVLVMFGGYWAVIPVYMSKLLGKPCFIILGGTDCVSFPSLHYGNLRSPFLKFILKRVYENATMLLPVHKSLIESENNYYRPEENKQGIKNNYEHIEISYREIYNGFDDSKFKLLGYKREKNSFISIASIDSDVRFKLKGGDLVFQLAEKFPDCRFYLVGLHETYLSKIKLIPENVTIIPFCKGSELVELLNKASFYMQLSISEGFPNALCEAMLCGCIPIGSNVGAIPDIIHDESRILKHRDLGEASMLVSQLLAKSETELSHLSELSRSRVIQNYSLRTRQKSLFDLIDNFQSNKA